MQILNILILVGAIQGFISSLLLYFSKKGSKVSNRLLAVIVLLISMACFNLFLMQSGVRYYSEISNALAYVIPLLIVMPLGPLIYLYAQSLVNRDFKITPKHRIHFYTVIVDLIPYLIGTTFIIGLSLNLLTKTDESSWRYFIDQYDVYSDIFRWTSIAIYLFLSWRILDSNHQRGLRILPWLKQFIIVFTVFQFLWLLHLIPYLLPAVRDEFMAWVDWYPIYLPLAVMVYWLGVNGYLRNPEGEILFGDRKNNSGSTLSAEVILQTQISLNEAMEKEHLFLDPLLSVEQVARHIGIPQKTISTVLNQHVGKSFNTFINGYRVEELKKRLVQPGNEHLSIMGLALECGFNSQATMQRTFKQITQHSPREYQLANKSEKTRTKLMNITQIQI